jgi:hypothetical protein
VVPVSKELTAAYVLDASGVGRGVKDAEGQLTKLDRDSKDLGDSFDKNTSRAGSGFTALGNQMGALGIPFSGAISKIGTDLDKAKSHAGGYGQVLSDVGKVATGALAGGLIAAGTESVHLAANFQTSMTELVTGAGESESAIGMVSKGIKAMAPAVGTTPQELAAGMYMIESAGYHGARGLTVLRAAAEGAKVGGADMATVADGLTTALNDYHLPATQAALVTSQLVATVAAGKTHMQDLAGSLGKVLPAASSAHIGLSQVLGAMSTMTAGGTPAADAATYLRQTILQLSNPTAAASKEMASLGLSSVDVAQHLGSRGLTGTLGVLTQAVASHTQGGLVWIATMQAQSKASASLAADSAKLGPGLTATAEGYERGTVSAAKYKKTLATLDPEQKTLMGSVASLTGTQDAAQKSLKGMTGTQQTVTAALAKMVGGTKSMQAALELTGGNAATFNANVKAIGATSTEAGGHVQGLSTVQHDLNFQIDQAKATAQSLGISFGQFLIPKLETVMSAVGGTVAWFEKHRAAAKALGAAIAGPLALVMAAFAINTGVKMVKSVTDASKALVGLGKDAVELGPKLLNVVSSGAQMATQYASQTAKMVASGGVWLAEHTAMAASFIAENVAMAASATAAFIAENIATLGIATAVAALIAGVVLLVTHWKAVWGEITKIADDVGKDLAGVWHGIERDAKAIWGDLEGFFKRWWPEIIGVMTGGVGLIPALLIQHWRQVEGDAKAVWGDVEHFFGAVWGGIKRVFMDATVVGLIMGHWRQIDADARNAWGGVVGFIQGIPGDIENVFASAGSWLVNAGEELMRGLANGITSAASGPVNAVENAGKSVISGVKHFFGIGSPSKEFADIGNFLMLGLEQGINGGADRPLAAVRGLAGQMAGTQFALPTPAAAAAAGGASVPVAAGAPGGNTYQVTIVVQGNVLDSSRFVATVGPALRQWLVGNSQVNGTSTLTI